MPFHFEPTINLGTLLVGSGLIITILKMHKENVKLLTILEAKVDMIWAWYKKEHEIED